MTKNKHPKTWRNEWLRTHLPLHFTHYTFQKKRKNDTPAKPQASRSRRGRRRQEWSCPPATASYNRDNQGMIFNSQAVADFWRLAPCKEIPWRTRWRGWCTGTVRLQRWQSSPKRPPDPHLQCTHPLPSTWNPMWNIITIHRSCLWIEKIISASLWIMVPYLMMPVSLKAPSSEVFL